MAGWIKLHRKIKENPFWAEKPFDKARAWIDIILSANHEPNEFLLGNEMVSIDRGSYITSEKKLMARWGWSKSKVRYFLFLLEKDSMIVKKSDSKKTTLEVLNYSIYQDTQHSDYVQITSNLHSNYAQKKTTLGVHDEPITGDSETAKRPQKDRKKTAKRPQKDTNKNDKEGEEGKEDITIDDFEQFWNAYPRKKSKGQAEKAWDKLNINDRFLTIILTAIKQSKNSADWQKENGQYIPYPATWLNAKGWEDIPDQQPKKESMSDWK